MKELTKAEVQVMQILWKIEKGFVKDIMKYFDSPKPAYNTVSTIIRILEKKGFVAHTVYGKTHEYYPLVSEEDYKKTFLKGIMKNYFGNSFKQLVSFFSKDETISINEMEEIMNMMKKEIKNKKETK